MDLFSHQLEENQRKVAPLSERMRPETLEDFFGQTHLFAHGHFLKKAIEADAVPSLIFWGPPGSGKTTLAYIIAKSTQRHFVKLSAVTAGIKDVRELVKKSKEEIQYNGTPTLLFVDEIHRFNKGQQDAFLPHVEDGTFTLIGATTENPSFELNNALLSRCMVLTLEKLATENLEEILHRALQDNTVGLGAMGVGATAVIPQIAGFADGDARRALNVLEAAVKFAKASGKTEVETEDLENALGGKTHLYDRHSEEHFNHISALHKALRGSDPDAGLYWLVRMLEAGEDPLYIARRLVRFASEDVGMADPGVLTMCMAGMEAMHFIGRPEGDLALAQCVVRLALTPKSNALYAAYNKVLADVQNKPGYPVPLHIRNAPTKLMKNLGYGKGYEYAHDHPDALVSHSHLPDELKGTAYYHPTERGYEKSLHERLQEIRRKINDK